MEGLDPLGLPSPLLHNHSTNFSQLAGSLPYPSGSYDLRHYLQDEDIQQGAALNGISSAMTASTLSTHINADGAHAAGATPAGWQIFFQKNIGFFILISQLLGHMHMLPHRYNCSRRSLWAH